MRCDTRSILLWGTRAFLPRTQFISVFLTRVSVARKSPDSVALCPKTKILAIRVLMNSVFVQSLHWDEMWHKVEISVGNPSVSFGPPVKIYPTPALAGLGPILSVFLNRVSVARRSPYYVALCPKTKSLTIRDRQRAAWLRRSLMNPVFT